MKTMYDVAIIGYGPGGEVLASTLGALGVRVLVVERWPKAYPLPRLTTIDGECCRVVQATGVDVDEAFKNTLVQESCSFVDAEGQPVLVVEFPGELGGWPSRVSMYQPDIEQAIANKVDAMPNVDVLRGWEASEMWQDENAVQMIITPFGRAEGESEGPRTIEAKYLVGTDGSRSFVRQMLGVGLRDHQMHERWLNFDAENLTPIPERLMSLKIFMDPERPHMFMPIGKRGLRMEFRVNDDETDQQVAEPGVVEEFMARKYGIDAKDFKIMRRVVYHYRTRMLEKWRVGRVFLAGDAAHTMPPFMGQGACAAIRDARNLGWKLAEVLAGRSSEALLDTYQSEREPHATAITMGSDALSRMVNIGDPVEAEKRNFGMRKQGKAHPPSLPSLTAGVLHLESDGSIAAPTGLSAPQARLRHNGAIVRGDTVLGSSFQLWCRKAPLLGSAEFAALKNLGCSIAVLQDQASEHSVEEADGVYTAYMDKYGVDCILMRPDFYIFGAVKANELGALVRELMSRLHSTAA